MTQTKLISFLKNIKHQRSTKVSKNSTGMKHKLDNKKMKLKRSVKKNKNAFVKKEFLTENRKKSDVLRELKLHKEEKSENF